MQKCFSTSFSPPQNVLSAQKSMLQKINVETFNYPYNILINFNQKIILFFSYSPAKLGIIVAVDLPLAMLALQGCTALL